MRVIIAGGGTGGHIFPAVAIANALKEQDASTQILFVGANGKMEMEKVPKEGYEIIGLDIVGFNRSNIFKNIWLPFKLWKSRQKAMQILESFKPDVVVGVGGFASFPILNAAQSKGIPTLIQEQNSFAGKSNKILGKKAEAICVAYEQMDKFFPANKIVITGNPVRKTIAASVANSAESRAFFGLDASKKVLLVVGGSLGAKSINEAIAASLPDLIAQDIQVLWQTGKNFIKEAQALMQLYPTHVFAHEFIYKMEFAYSAADLIVSRAGALAIAEICIVAKPTIFVPYPFAAEDHQTSNAMALVNKSAAWMVKDDLVKTALLEKILQLANNANLATTMTSALNGLAIRDADVRIVSEIKSIALK